MRIDRRFFVVLTLSITSVAAAISAPQDVDLPERPGREAVEAARRRLDDLSRDRSRMSYEERLNELRELEARFGLGEDAERKANEKVKAVLANINLPDSFGEEARRMLAIERPRIESTRAAQQRLSELGFLNGPRDVDGKFGPKTRSAIQNFQRAQNLPVSGTLDWKTEAALVPDAFEVGVAEPLMAEFRLENLRSNLVSPFRLEDASGKVLYWGDDQAELSRKINESLSGGDRSSIYVELLGFTEDKAEALAATLRIHQRSIYPSVSIAVLPHLADGVALHDALFTPGVRLDDFRREDAVRSIATGKDAGKFESTKLTFHTGKALREVTVRVVSAIRELINEFLALVWLRLPPGHSDDNQSLSQIIEEVIKELRSRHKGLTDEQFRLEILHQSTTIKLGRLDDQSLLRWS